MSLLELCQDLAREQGFPSPAAIVSATSDDLAQRLYASARAACRELRRKSWAVLRARQTITTANGTADYDLADGLYPIADTFWNATTNTQIIGPISLQDYERLKSGVVTTTVDDLIAITQEAGNRQITIHPTPTATETIQYWAHNENLILDVDGSTTKSQWAADDDEPRIPEDVFLAEMRWRLLRMLGLPFSDEKMEAERVIDTQLGREISAPILRLAPRRRSLTQANIPETGFGS